MLNEEIKEHIASAIVRGPFGRLIGLSLDHAEADRCIVKLPITAELVNANGIVHGGATVALIDAAATAAAWATNRVIEATRGTTVALTTNFLAPGRDGTLLAEARVVQRGGTLSIISVEVHDAKRQVATALITYKLDLKRGREKT